MQQRLAGPVKTFLFFWEVGVRDYGFRNALYIRRKFIFLLKYLLPEVFGGFF